MHLAVAIATMTSAWLSPAQPTRPTNTRTLVARRTAVTMDVIEATESCAQAQRATYFELMPSRELPKVSLDLRAWANTDADCFEAGVFARQEGTVDKWKNVGVVAATTADALTAAVAKQRLLIERWAYEICTDFETNELLMQLDGPPVEISWAIKPSKPSLFDSLMGKQPEREVFVEVPADASFDEDMRCGFLGVLAREYRGGGVSARYDRIVLGKEPEAPVRSASQTQYDGKYKKSKGKKIVV